MNIETKMTRGQFLGLAGGTLISMSALGGIVSSRRRLPEPGEYGFGQYGFQQYR